MWIASSKSAPELDVQIRVESMMEDRVLCEGGLTVMVGGSGDRTLLYVKDGGAVRFWCDTFALEMALLGQPLNLEAFGGSCHLEVEGDAATILFKSEGYKDHTCNFPKKDLADAVRHVREFRPD